MIWSFVEGAQNRFRLQIQIADSDCRFRFRLQIQIQIADSGCGFKIERQISDSISDLDFKFQITDFRFESAILNLQSESAI